ncbi:hypothetical protein N7451_006750 [Penicillium sp. IBT 35674x]|nr:hypothetical protein N7451_006750 [Penicillium sp. IBT 35674x]
MAIEALRHATMRLGGYGHDGSSGKFVANERPRPQVREARKIMSRLLRLLGRMNGKDSNMNED